MQYDVLRPVCGRELPCPQSILNCRPAVLIADVGYRLPKYNYDVH